MEGPYHLEHIPVEADFPTITERFHILEKLEAKY